MTRVERKVSQIIDWQTVRYHTNMISVYIDAMLDSELCYTGDIRYHLEAIEELFKSAYEQADEEILNEEEVL